MRIAVIRDVKRTKNVPIPRKNEPATPELTAVWVITNEISPRGPDATPQRSTSFNGTLKNFNMNVNANAFDKIATIETSRVAGAHRGIWMGIKPTGKVVMYTGININKVIEGLIVKYSGAANLFESLFKIGTIKIISDDK